MSRKAKVLVSVLVVAVLLTVGGAATVMAQDEPPPPAGEEAAPPEEGTEGLLARVADILGVTQEELVDAFRQARQGMMEEAFFNCLDRAVEEGLITQEEADEIKEWWQQKPEALDHPALRARVLESLRGRRTMSVLSKPMPEGCLTQEQAVGIRGRWQSRVEALERPALRARIFKEMRGRQQIAVSKRWRQLEPLEAAD